MFPLNKKPPLGGVCPQLGRDGADDKHGDVQDPKALAGAGQVCPPPCLAQHLEACPPLPRWVMSFLPEAVLNPRHRADPGNNASFSGAGSSLSSA